jgi:hypothetical protein
VTTDLPEVERTRRLFGEPDAGGLEGRVEWMNRYIVALETVLLERGLDDALDNAVRIANGEEPRSMNDPSVPGVSRAERRRQERAERKGTARIRIDADGDYGVQPAWFHTLDDLEEAKKATHDAVIEQMGDQRIGPVRWGWWTGAEARQQLAVMQRGPMDPQQADYYAQIGAHLTKWGGYFIVAMAEGRPSPVRAPDESVL